MDELDLRGLKCPLPALMTRRRLAQMPPGTVLTVWTSDPLAVIDIPHMCAEDGHDVTAARKADSHHIFTIRRG
jgi:tRNA 2-thiouridine synthesizing protein A